MTNKKMLGVKSLMRDSLELLFVFCNDDMTLYITRLNSNYYAMYFQNGVQYFSYYALYCANNVTDYEKYYSSLMKKPMMNVDKSSFVKNHKCFY